MVTELSVLFLILFISFDVFVHADDDDFCYSQDENPYKKFGQKTSYDAVSSANITKPSGCTTTFIWAIYSQGTRSVSEIDGLIPKELSDIRDEIIKNHETYERGELCEDDLNLLKNWKFPWNEKSYGELSAPGKKEMENLAGRMKSKFSSYFESCDKLKFYSCSKKLSQDSAKAYKNKLCGSDTNITVEDDLFNVGHYMNASENEELNKFFKSNIMEDYRDDMSSRLGFNKTLDIDSMMKIYKQCSLEQANYQSTKIAFCATFLPDHLEVLEYCDDLDTYYALGYGDTKNSDRACPTVQNLYKHLDHAANYQHLSERGIFLVGAHENLFPLFSKLGMFKDKEALKHNNYDKLADSRSWRTSNISPFASNLICVMYNCSNELKVIFYSNEGIVQYPGCENGVCSWSSLKEQFNNHILKSCGEPSAAALLSINSQVSILIYSIIVISLVHTLCTLLK